MWIIINKILNTIFPEKCFGCAKQVCLLCAECKKLLLYPTPGNKDKIWGAVAYESKIIKKMIWTLKYKKAKRLAKPLAELIAERTNFNYRCSTSIVIPVPLSKKRLRERGFNQAELIAKSLSDILDVPVIKNVLYKNKHTTSQVLIKNRQERLNNLKNAFIVRRPELIKNKKIYLIDDVSTTGTTISECRKVLLKSGCKEVIGLVVAK